MTESKKLRYSDIDVLLNAHKSISKRNNAAKNIFDGETTFRIVKNIRNLTAALEPFNEFRNELVNQYSDGSGAVAIDSPAFPILNKELNERNVVGECVELYRLDYSKMNGKTHPDNEIGADELVALFDILDNFEHKE